MAQYLGSKLCRLPPPPHHPNLTKRLVKIPKLYFYDVGLASYLLGIEHQQQLVTHPLRGGLFENLVIIEALKHRYNSGKQSNLYFYRDSSGHEIDLIYTLADRLLAVEIKAGETVSGHFFNGLRKLAQLLPEQIAGQVLVFGGSATYVRTGIHVTSPLGFSHTLRQLETHVVIED